MKKGIDITGQKFGRWTALSFSHRSKGGHWAWNCKCDCGTEAKILGTRLIKGKTTSCGCYKREWSKEKHTTHGMRHHKLYPVYDSMKRRCYNPNDKGYINYGGRGITVCDEWLTDPSTFFKWAFLSGYEEGLSIDRINNDGNYEPGNCRWASRSEQLNNTRVNHLITFNGETHTITQWSRITGINKGTLRDRIEAGWSEERALTTPVRKHKKNA
jgi:hypothetical protein